MPEAGWIAAVLGMGLVCLCLGLLVGRHLGYQDAKHKALEQAKVVMTMDEAVGAIGLLTPEQHLSGLQTNVRNTYERIREM